MGVGKLVWDRLGEKFFELGVEQVALYTFKDKEYQDGVAWNGITKISEGKDGGDENELYADDIKYGSIRGVEKFNPTIEAYTYPDEFAECDGSKAPVTGVHVTQQKRVPFGLVYKSKIGNDTDGIDAGYMLHLVYGCTASPSERERETVNDSPDAMTFSWECTTTPEAIDIDGYRPTAHIEIDSTKLKEAALTKLQTLEEFVYGTATAKPQMPTADSVVKFMRGDTGAELIHYTKP